MVFFTKSKLEMDTSILRVRLGVVEFLDDPNYLKDKTKISNIITRMKHQLFQNVTKMKDDEHTPFDILKYVDTYYSTFNTDIMNDYDISTLVDSKNYYYQPTFGTQEFDLYQSIVLINYLCKEINYLKERLNNLILKT